jgi:hypothetical protein
MLQSGTNCERVDDVTRVTGFDYADIKSGYAASNVQGVVEQRTSKGFEGGGRNVISGVIPSSVWRDRNNNQAGQSVRVFETWTRNLPLTAWE